MERFRTRDGRTLTYRRTGSGPMLVCHPGGPGFSSRYFADFAGLGDAFTLALLNPRGTAGSDRPADARAYATEDYVADLDEFREHLGLERMLLLGHSHGGVVAQAYAAAHPDRVERLVLASTLARFQAEQAAAMEASIKARQGEPWYDGRAGRARGRAGRGVGDGRGPGGARTPRVPVLLRRVRRARAGVPEAARRRGPVRRRAEAVQRGGLHDLRPPAGAARASTRRRS